jgi:hypothetical protein
VAGASRGSGGGNRNQKRKGGPKPAFPSHCPV